jgi:hypothetical protein
MGDEADRLVDFHSGLEGEYESYNTYDIETEEKAYRLQRQIERYQRLYKRAEAKNIGCRIQCPTCGNRVIKKVKQQKFCGTKCKDRYHNLVNEKRRERSQLFKG